MTLSANNVAVNGALSVTSGTLAIGTYNLPVTGASSISGTGTVTIGISSGTGWTTAGMTIDSGGTVTCTGASKIYVAGSWDSSLGTFTKGYSTVYLTESGDVKINGSAGFYFLSMAASTKTTTLQSNIYVYPSSSGAIGDPLILGGGIIAFNGKTLYVYFCVTNTSVDGNNTTATGSGSLTLNGYPGCIHTITDLNLGSNVNLNFTIQNSAWSVTFLVGGTITCGEFKTSGSNVGQQVLVQTVEGLSLTCTGMKLPGSGHGGFNGSAGGTINVNGDVTIGNMTSLALGATVWNVTGNWTNSYALLDAGNSTVNFTGANQTISGSTTFYNLSKDVSADVARTLTFTSGSVQTITHALILKGASGKVLTLVSSSTPSKAVLTVSSGATYTVDYVNVKDNDASRGLAINATNSTDSGNNLNWGFGVSAVPVLSNFVPASGSTITSSPTITFTLSIIGDCYASLGNNWGYDNMVANSAVNCAGDGTLSGTCQMPNLGSVGSKTIYFACKDNFGNKNLDGTDQSVTYTLATPSGVTSLKGKLNIKGKVNIR
jgi:hypothetical protein